MLEYKMDCWPSKVLSLFGIKCFENSNCNNVAWNSNRIGKSQHWINVGICFNYSSDCEIYIIQFMRCLCVYGNPTLTPVSRGRKPKFRGFLLSQVTPSIRLLRYSSSLRISSIHNVCSHVYLTHSLLFDFLCLRCTELLEFSLLKALLLQSFPISLRKHFIVSS
jgi:CRISPR/Cas system-associated protein endoribonuclease Cas2